MKSDIKDLREKGGIVDTTVVIACAKAMVNRVHKMIKDCKRITVTRLASPMPKSLLQPIGYVNQKPNTFANVEHSHFKELKK